MGKEGKEDKKAAASALAAARADVEAAHREAAMARAEAEAMKQAMVVHEEEESEDEDGSLLETGHDDYDASDEKDKKPKAMVLGLSVLILVGLQVGTHFFTREMYLSSGGEEPLYLHYLFLLGVGGTAFLSFLVPFFYKCVSSRVLWISLIALIPLWAGTFCAVNFMFMAASFPKTCSFYAATGVLEQTNKDVWKFSTVGQTMVSAADGIATPVKQLPVEAGSDLIKMGGFGGALTADNVTEFTHIECPRPSWSAKVPARVIAVFMGHTYGVSMPLAIGIMGWLAAGSTRTSDSSSLARAIGSISVDFIDWQDFTLTLIDDEVLKTYWGKGDNGYGGSWLWKVLLGWCIVSFLTLTFELIYNFTLGLRSGNADDGDTNEMDKEDLGYTPFSTGDYVTTATSLFFIEIPFLVWRAYVGIRFDVAPSSLILKNVLSIPKEFAELVLGRHLSMGGILVSVGAK